MKYKYIKEIYLSIHNMSLNIQLNEKEINQTVVENILKLLERRESIESWETEYDKLKTDLQSKTVFELTLKDKTKCGIYIVNSKLTTIVKGTPLDQYLSNNIDIHKFIIIRDVLKKVITQIIHEHTNAEFFFEAEMLEDIPSKDFIPHHTIIRGDEKKELLSKYNERELANIFINDMMCRYYGGKVGDIFKIIRPSFTAGYNIFYRKVVPSSIDIIFK